ncbi:MAG: 4'-phosphopantetheinyl transferase superfamily protein [Bacteroidota bacterium]|jgi:4'-phosphopantetheinyl transferase|nr:MAG: 4-phosphopantetheinyl transferase [Bacteroidota bacterium]
MPLEKIEDNRGNPWGLWRIEEDETQLEAAAASPERIPETIRHPHKRLEWHAARVLVKTLMHRCGLTFHGIIKDTFGKPFPAGSDYHLSLSHSYPYVAAYLHATNSVGIDIQPPRPSLLRIAHRILDPSELAFAGSDLNTHCVIWCAKEVLIKVHGRKDLIFSKNLKISPFSINSKGYFSGSIIVGPTETEVRLYYEMHPAFALVLNKPEPT